MKRGQAGQTSNGGDIMADKIIGILTGGGDAPALNAVIRGITYKGIKSGFTIYGFHLGWKGMLEKDYEELTIEKVSDIHREGGTILGSSRTNVFKKERGPEIIEENIKELGLYCLVAIGGDDTLGVAAKLYEKGINVVGVPKTIDNDVEATDYTFGFDTAINRVCETLDWLHTTTKSHRRVMVVEIMGRHSGWITLHGGIAGGAHFILIPEEPFDTDQLCEQIKKRHETQLYTIVAVAEGAKDPKLDKHIMRAELRDEFGNVVFSKGIGIGMVLANEIGDRTGFETRHVVLGHLQRGGRPSAFDRVLGTRFGAKVIELIENQEFGKMVALKGTEILPVPLQDAINKRKQVPLPRFETAKIFFG
jgi:6-phosphofructokinase 1